MKFRLITGADVNSFETAVNEYLESLAAQPGTQVQVFQPFSTDHSQRFCVGVLSRDMFAEQQAAAEAANRYKLTPVVEDENRSGASGEGNGQNGAGDGQPAVVEEPTPTPVAPSTEVTAQAQDAGEKVPEPARVE